MQEKRKVRLIMVPEVYKKNRWPIPIVKDGGRYLTGQDLTTKEMLGEIELNEVKLEKYPFVINPQTLYYGVDHKVYDLALPQDYALYNLMLLTNVIAPTEDEYKRHRKDFIGYFFDPEQEAINKNEFLDKAFEAETRVRKLPIEEYDRYLAVLLYKIPEFTLDGSLNMLSPDRKRNMLIEQCKNNPEDVLNCFEDNNPGIEDEIFFIELLNRGILRETNDGSIMYGTTFCGENLMAVQRFVAKEENEYLRKKWQIMLDERKGYVRQGASEGVRQFTKKNSLASLQKAVIDKGLKDDEKFKDIFNDREALIVALNALNAS